MLIGNTLIKHLLRNRNFIFLLAIITGLLFPRGTKWTEPLLLPVLAVVMTLSTMGISNNIFRFPRSLLFPALMGILMNYVLLGTLIIALAAILIHKETLWTGFVILAAAPPAVAVIPFSAFLKGDSTYSLFGTVGAYLGALIIMPLMAVGFLGSTSLDPSRLLAIMIQVIIFPLVVSRILVWKGWHERIEPVKGVITDWGFFLILYTIMGLNRDTLIGMPLTLLPVAAIAFAGTFLLGFLIEWTGRLFRINREVATSLVLLGTLKNCGLAGGIALTLYSREAALPAVVSTVFIIIYVIWLDFKKQWDRSTVELPR